MPLLNSPLDRGRAHTLSPAMSCCLLPLASTEALMHSHAHQGNCWLGTTCPAVPCGHGSPCVSPALLRRPGRKLHSAAECRHDRGPIFGDSPFAQRFQYNGRSRTCPCCRLLDKQAADQRAKAGGQAAAAAPKQPAKEEPQDSQPEPSFQAFKGKGRSLRG